MTALLAAIAALGVAGVGAWAAVRVASLARDVAMRVLDERRAAREAARVDHDAIARFEARCTRLEQHAERWDTAAREVSAMSGRRKG